MSAIGACSIATGHNRRPGKIDDVIGSDSATEHTLQKTSSLHPNPHYGNQRPCMRFSKRVSVLIFGLLLGGVCSPGAKASADESLTPEPQAPEQNVSVAYLTAVPVESGDLALPD